MPAGDVARAPRPANRTEAADVRRLEGAKARLLPPPRPASRAASRLAFAGSNVRRHILRNPGSPSGRRGVSRLTLGQEGSRLTIH